MRRLTKLEVIQPIEKLMIKNKIPLFTIPILATIMVVATVTPAFAGIVIVEIDIKPGSDPNSVNFKSKGVLPVAILTTDTFDATTVNPDTLIFTAAVDLSEDKVEPNCVRHGIEDVDGDGDLDLVCKFPQKTTWITCDTTQGVITGETFSGQFIRGFDSINPVGKECNNNS